jgi:branched-chain amino acid transport system ATP-binding protein
MIAHLVCDALVKISQLGTTTLLVEQNAKMALKIAHYGYILEAGRIVLKGTSEN